MDRRDWRRINWESVRRYNGVTWTPGCELQVAQTAQAVVVWRSSSVVGMGFKDDVRLRYRPTKKKAKGLVRSSEFCLWRRHLGKVEKKKREG